MYNILTFNGGGIRGLLSARMLLRLLEQFPKLLEETDLFAGTSVGAAIAAHLASGGDVSAFQDWVARELAAQTLGHPGTDPRRPAYSVEAFAASQELIYGRTTLGELPKKVVLTSFRIGGGRPWEPLLFHNFSEEAGRTPVRDAVVSSGAMPGMYGSYQGCIDGAFVHHDPTLVAIAFAVQAGVPLEEIALIDVGTGYMPETIPASEDTARWGTAQWESRLSALPSLFVNSPAGIPILNVSLNGTSTNTVAILAGMMLGPRFANLNPTLDRPVAENDVKAIPYLEQVASQADLGGAAEVVQRYWASGAPAASVQDHSDAAREKRPRSPLPPVDR